MGGTWSSYGNPQFPLIDEHIKNHCIVVYSTTVCGFCTKAKSLLSELNLDYNVVELDGLGPSEGGMTSQELIKKTNIRTVPQIFINGQFIGGYSEVQQLKQNGAIFEKITHCKNSCTKK